MRLIAQNNAQQRTVNFHAAVVINEAQFSKFVHEMAHTGGRRGRAVVRPQSCMVASIRPDVFRCGLTLRWWLDQGRFGLATNGRLSKIDHLGSALFNLTHYQLARPILIFPTRHAVLVKQLGSQPSRKNTRSGRHCHAPAHLDAQVELLKLNQAGSV
jgi:hypothetical protein